jgi:hypothetical protein
MNGLFIMLFDHERSYQAHDRLFVGEYANDVRPTFHLPFNRSIELVD